MFRILIDDLEQSSYAHFVLVETDECQMLRMHLITRYRYESNSIHMQLVITILAIVFVACVFRE